MILSKKLSINTYHLSYCHGLSCNILVFFVSKLYYGISLTLAVFSALLSTPYASKFKGGSEVTQNGVDGLLVSTCVYL